MTAAGRSLLFLTEEEQEYIDHLKEHRLEITTKPLEPLLATAHPRLKDGADHIQTLCQRAVDSEPLLSLSRDAFRSFVRSYATHSRSTKHIFRVQSMHLGHVAKSFGLSEAPQLISKRVDSKRSKLLKDQKQQHQQHHQQHQQHSVDRSYKSDEFVVPSEMRTTRKRTLVETVSEFDSGLSASTQPPAKRRRKQ